MKDFSKYEFRCSQIYKIASGSLLSVSDLDNEIKDLLEEKKTLTSKTGRKVKWTEKKQKSLDARQAKRKNYDVVNGFILPKTMTSELRNIFRMEKYNRNFPFTNKYIQKGIQQEEEAITTYQNYRNSIGKKTLFSKNTERLKNGWVSGEPDLGQFNVPIKEWKEGWDTKCSWSLETFPFLEDELIDQYNFQNQGYMWLTGAKKWTTVSILVNATEHQLNNEKQKWFYALQMPASEEDKYWSDYQKKCREVEKMMIYDYERFVKVNPYHDLTITKDEWFGEGYDIPLEERILEKTVEYDESLIELFKERIEIGREYLKTLQNK